MGVTGLWRLVEPAGKPVPVETLENKVLAVDISIWLHQVVKGYQDARGAPLPNAHLIGLFQRVCKLLYFRIKPVFVFDGAFPELKKETIAKRQDSKNKYNSESERLKRELVVLLGKKTAIGSLLGKQISPTKKNNNADTSNDDLFKLPALPQKEESEPESDDEEDTSSGSLVDLHSVDLQSDHFKAMPAKEKYDLLLELKETRKMNSWGKLHTLPKKSDNFSDFQMQRLLKRRKVQECIEETEKEMGDIGMSLNDLESLLNEEGIDTKIESLPTRRIASNNNTRFLLINNVKEALAKAKERKVLENKPETSTNNKTPEKLSVLQSEESSATKNELEDDLQKAIQMSLECVDEPNTSSCQSKTDDSWTSVLTDTDYTEASDSEGELEVPDVTTAKAYIMQYSDYSHKAIEEIVGPQIKGGKSKPKVPKVNRILKEISKENSVIVDHVALSSSDEESDRESSSCTQIDKETDAQNQRNKIVDEDLVSTQASVLFFENTEPDVISLDSSQEEAVEKEEEINCNESIKVKDSDSSDDDEFEEVPEIENKSRQPVVELTLNIDDAPKDDDDIFADVFAPMTQPNSINFSNIAINIENKSQFERFVPKIDPCDKNQESITSNNLGETSNVSVSTDEILKESTTNTTSSVRVEAALEEIIERTLPSNKKNHDDDNDKAGNSLTIDFPEGSETSEETVKPVNSDIINDPAPVESNKTPKEPLTEEQLNTMVEEIQNEEQDLMQEKGRLDRIGRNITEQMTKEAQELLQIFGIPYIVAPMEAEAQCAFLESIKLTDGTITDDSDIWLFGGQTVYKNFFNQKKHVLQYISERIEKSFNLTREQLILLALLVGSDYTTGVAGVGPVTAMEILASFPFNKKQVLTETSKQVKYAKLLDGLKEFKLWVRAGKRTDNTSLKKKLRNVTLTDDFPSMRVVQAYLEPNVERSKEKFTWGELDITVLRDYAKSKFGWSQTKFDEIIKPVLARMKDRKNQRTVHDYFQRKVEFQSLEDQMSKRVKAAVQKMCPGGCIEENPNNEESTKTSKKRKKVIKHNTENEAGSSKPKQRRKQAQSDQVVKVVSEVKDGKSDIEINIAKTDRCQEIIPQREKDKQHLLENKLKAIEIFRKTTIDRKRKLKKRKVNLPKEDAGLSENSDSE